MDLVRGGLLVQGRGVEKKKGFAAILGYKKRILED